MRRYIKAIVIICLLGYASLPFVAQAQAQQPIVYGVFFYSPTCPHCHEVINNHWGGIQAEFGDQLRVIFIDVQRAEGAQLMQITRQALSVEARGVPMLIIGEHVLIGSQQIPNQTAAIVRAGLANGGIAIPPIPEIAQVFAQIDANHAVTVETAAPAFSMASILSDSANIIAIAVLIALIASLLLVLAARLIPTLGTLLEGNLPPTALLLTIATAIALSSSLLFGSDRLSVTILTLSMNGALIVVMIHLFNNWSLRRLPEHALPLLLFTGVIVASYLSYVEMTASEATCGIMGQCNVVQQSAYARLWIVPIGVIGIAGYLAMGIVWAFRQRFAYAIPLLFMMIVVGILFSAYLTFLEPFVIGATCVWCLISALIMLALLWLIAPRVWRDQKAQDIAAT